MITGNYITCCEGDRAQPDPIASPDTSGMSDLNISAADDKSRGPQPGPAWTTRVGGLTTSRHKRGLVTEELSQAPTRI